MFMMRNANDVLLIENLNNLQQLLHRLHDAMRSMGWEINVSNIKVVLFDKKIMNELLQVIQKSKENPWSTNMIFISW